MPIISDDQRLKNKHHILMTAKALFERQGYVKTSVNHIVKSAGISKGGFYTYYDSKESLFFDLIYAFDEEIFHHNKGRAYEKDALKDYIDFRLRRYMNHGNKTRVKYALEFWACSALNDQQVKDQEARYRAFEKDLTKVIKWGIKQGYFRSDVEWAPFIQVLIATIDGLIMSDSVFHRSLNESAIETCKALFNSYLEV